MTNWPPQLISSIARRRAIIVIGSGVSRHSLGVRDQRPPMWKAFLEKALDDCPNTQNIEHIHDAISQGDYLHACEWIKLRYDDHWSEYLRNQFMNPRYEPADIHEKILKLDVNTVFSLNFDNIYERYANSIHAGSYIVKNYYDIDVHEFLRGNNRYIVKPHGTIQDPLNLIFTQKDYASARIKHSSFYQSFNAALLTNTFFFIGSGFTDPDINLLLENYKFNFPSSNPHYFLTAQDVNQDKENSLRENRNIKLIKYDKINDDHSGLVSCLEELVTIIDDKRQELVENAGW